MEFPSMLQMSICPLRMSVQTNALLSGRRRRTAHLTKTECLFQGHPVLPDKQARALQIQQDDCQQNQDNSLCCVYYISRAWEEVTTEPVQHSKNRLLISVIKRKSVQLNQEKTPHVRFSTFTPLIVIFYIRIIRQFTDMNTLFHKYKTKCSYSRKQNVRII